MGHTTFIVGAGASCEFGLVDGARLRDRIAAGLDQYQFTGIWMGREESWQAKSTLASALRTALSIDDCMHTHQASPLIQQLGKWAIVHEILSQERESCLTLDEQGVNFTAKPLSRGKDGESLLFDTWSSWLVSLFRLLTAECTVDEIPDRMSRVSFIVFNYDRCIEHALVQLLTMKLGGNREAATAIARGVDIIHPYGCLGAPWEKAPPFGIEPNRAPYQLMTERIRTFTETPSDKIREHVHASLRKADTVVFLGFSFLSLNMRLLASHIPGDLRPQRCWGTAYRTSEVDRDHAIRAITEVARTRPAIADGGAYWPRLDNMTCADFIMHNQRAFDFAN